MRTKTAIRRVADAIDGRRPIRSEEIGNVRRALFVEGYSGWNALVRDLTASLERPADA